MIIVLFDILIGIGDENFPLFLSMCFSLSTSIFLFLVFFLRWELGFVFFVFSSRIFCLSLSLILTLHVMIDRALRDAEANRLRLTPEYLRLQLALSLVCSDFLSWISYNIEDPFLLDRRVRIDSLRVGVSMSLWLDFRFANFFFSSSVHSLPVSVVFSSCNLSLSLALALVDFL